MTAPADHRLAHLAFALALVAVAPAARAQNFTVALTPVAAPLSNGTTQNHASSVYYNVTNSKANTNATQVEFRLPSGYTAQGGLPPAGWTLTRIYTSGGNGRVQFRTADCTLPGASIVNGQTVTFRVDVTPPAAGISGDTTDYLNSVRPTNPCGANGNWTLQSNNSIPLPRKVLWVTASAAPLSGPSPLPDTLTVTVKNESNVSKTGVTVAPPTVTASSGATYVASACSAVTSPLTAGATSAITCNYTLTAALSSVSTFGFAATASGPTATALGASAGPVVVGPATATFAFDNLAAGPGDAVEATLAVKNNTSTSMTITPPTFAQLAPALQNVAKGAGTTDPLPATVGPGGTAQFIYALTVTGVVSSRYQASGTAGTTAGNTNLAVTPPGTVAASRVDWLPSGIVKSRAGGVYEFTITVVNNSNVSVSEIDVINPQPTTWTGIYNVRASGISYTRKTTTGGIDTLVYTGTLAAHGTATLVVRFTSIPDVTSATGSVDYNFQVKVIPASSGSNGTFYYQTVTDTWPIDDVANLSVLSTATGQTLYWTNTTRPDTEHDGVVVFRAFPPAVPGNPSDGTDYATSPTPPANTTLVYSDKDGSSVATVADSPAGAFNYLVCNHDDNFIYSKCDTTGFPNNPYSGYYLESVALPSSGVSWAHALGLAIYGYPGAYQLTSGPASGTTRLAVATNVPALAVLDAITGHRPFDPVALNSLPNVGTPAAPLGNGAALAFGADNSGKITAVDLQGGLSGWSATKNLEKFVGGVAGVLKQYVGATYQASYSTDVLFMGSSTSGNLLAVDAWTGASLWTKAPATAGAHISTQPHYDYLSNRLYVAYDSGGGIVAYQNLGSGAAPGAPLWSKAGASYLTPCTFGAQANQIACIDSGGFLHAFHMDTGAEMLNAATPGYDTKVANASSLWPVTAGYVVSNATVVKRLTVSGGAVTLEKSWTPAGGVTLAPLLVVGNYIYVAASDKKIHKLNLADATDTGVSVTLNPSQAGATLSAPAVDPWDNLFLLGSSDGRLWAVPLF